MREIILAGAFALSTSTCLAQTATPPAPATPQSASPIEVAAPPQGGPANLCQELLGFMKAPPEAPQAADAKKTAATADQQAKPQQPASSQQGSAGLAGTAATGKDPSGGGGSNSAQAVTGQDGVATDAPEPGKGKADAGSVANAPQKESRAAPLPPADVTSTPKESVLSVEEAQQLADANDIAQCQETAREMRVAGVAMPPPLIALAALDIRYQQNPGAVQVPSGTGGPEQND
ncbi:hypothetical protein FB004_103263 [Sinorhizobium medicae]|uniref:Uncharacterized protein n=1 Tax=Sinorhizobium medicae TaxID=110321 RepID=A0A508X7X8_9HYPH|nr:hypothetical protein [Sinorhizobium medicae]PLU02541.1 hypothetical protein BMJ33_16455 [Sinorhizobium medicae]PLU13235.1 hypothetical protein BMJ30_25880 [Sinorhizobium medicae]PLU33571.1 hypothetical protein BMJ27_16480 [Sinorhizobium medicae]RVJ83406.1 hypothetical protein CN168_06545 [Sinorhizobium medicae]TWA26157.1 hypothetical protein FB004_103263 [Sinorhizobium medicae]